MENLLDFVIRNQGLLFTGIATLVLLWSIAALHPAYLLTQLRVRLSDLFKQWRGRQGLSDDLIVIEWRTKAASTTIEPTYIFTYRRYLRFALGLVGALGLMVVGSLKPVPQTAALPLPELSRDSPTNKKLVVFVHGWGGEPVGTWQKFPQLVQEDQTFNSFNLLTIGYPTFLTRRNLSVKLMARWLDDHFEREDIYRRYEGIWIFAHSMGGLIARELVIANRISRGGKPYKFLIEIASPHQGASVAALAKALGVSRGLVDDLTPGSPFLSNLREDWNGLSDRPSTFCLTSPHDSVVSEESAITQCDRYLRYPQWGHIEMVKPHGHKDDRYATPMSRVKP